jgi:hypothetical protein
MRFWNETRVDSALMSAPSSLDIQAGNHERGNEYSQGSSMKGSLDIAKCQPR